MTRIAIAIVITLIVFAALIIMAGRTDWYGVSYRMSSGAIETIDALTDDESDSDAARPATRAISDPATWNRDFMRDARPSADCPTDTVPNVRARMAAIGPYTADEFERTVAYYSSTDDETGQRIPTYNNVPEVVRRSITMADRIYAFGFDSLTANNDALEISGYFVARDDCILHVEVTSIDN